MNRLCERPWVASLTENKAKWTELAEIDKKKKEAEAEAAKEGENSNTESSGKK